MPEGTEQAADAGEVETSICVSQADIDLLGHVADRLRGLQRRAARTGEGAQSGQSKGVGPQLLPIARLLLRQRRERALAFADCEFGEAVWDVMLQLYVSHYEQRQVGAYALAGLIRVPPSTALRWIATMEQNGQLIRESDEADRRRSLVTLAPAFRARLEVHLESFRQSILAMDPGRDLQGAALAYN